MIHDVIVVGGSFAGLSAAIQLGRARRKVLILDHGLTRNRFADASHGFLGQDGKAPAAIVREARAQVLAYPTVERIAGEAVSVSGHSGAFTVTLADGQAVSARRLILASGVSDGLPDLPGVKERWGATVHLCPYCHGYELRDRPLGVLACMPMSAHQAVLIPDWGPTTYFTQGLYEPNLEQAAQLAARGVTVERSPIVAMLGTAPDLEAVQLADGRVLPLGGLFLAPRASLNSDLPAQLGLALGEGHLGPFIQVDDFKATSVPGVFAAGDAARAMHNATLASADGVMAGVGAHQSLVQEAALAA